MAVVGPLGIIPPVAVVVAAVFRGLAHVFASVRPVLALFPVAVHL